MLNLRKLEMNIAEEMHYDDNAFAAACRFDALEGKVDTNTLTRIGLYMDIDH